MLIPAGYRILLKMQEVAEKTEGGIYLAATTKDADEAAQEFGEVVAMGKHSYYDMPSTWCEVGDIVGIARYGGRVTIDPDTGEKFRMINDKDVQCIKV